MTRRDGQGELRKVSAQFAVRIEDDRLFAGCGRSCDENFSPGRKRQQLLTNWLRVLDVFGCFDFCIAGDDDLCRETEFPVSTRVIIALRKDQGRVAERILEQSPC